MKKLFNQNRNIVFILLAAIFLRLLFVICAPLGTDTQSCIPGFNDELSHYNYIKYLAEHRRLPVQTISIKDTDAFNRNEFEYYQPPLYYVLSVPLYLLSRPLGTNDYFFLRLLPLLFGIATLYIVYRALALIFKDSMKALTGLLLLSLLGVHVRFSSLVSNDSLLWLIASSYIYVLIQMVYKGCLLKYEIMIVVLSAAGMLTKSSFLLLFPAVFIPYLDSWRLKTLAAKIIRPLGIIVIGICLCAPWYYRNILIYGNLLPLDVGHGSPMGTGFPLWKTIAFIFYQNSFSFWFPFVIWPYPHSIKIAASGYAVLSMFIFIFSVCVFYFRKRNGYHRLFPLALSVFVPFCGGYVRYSAIYNQVNARLLLPVQILVVSVIVWFAYRLMNNHIRRVNGAVIVVCTLPYLAAFLFY